MIDKMTEEEIKVRLREFIRAEFRKRPDTAVAFIDGESVRFVASAASCPVNLGPPAPAGFRKLVFLENAAVQLLELDPVAS